MTHLLLITRCPWIATPALIKVKYNGHRHFYVQYHFRAYFSASIQAIPRNDLRGFLSFDVFKLSFCIFKLSFLGFLQNINQVFCNLMKTQTLFLRISPYFGEFQLNFAILDHLGS